MTMSYLVTLIVATSAVLIALLLAWVPMRILVTHMARTVSAIIQRQRDRRAMVRGTPDRRRAM